MTLNDFEGTFLRYIAARFSALAGLIMYFVLRKRCIALTAECRTLIVVNVRHFLLFFVLSG